MTREVLPLVRVTYTGQITKEELTEQLNELFSRFLDELYEKENPEVDED